MACSSIVQCTILIPLYIRNHVRFALRVYPAHVDCGVCDAAGAKCTSPRCNAETRQCRSKSGRSAASTSTDLHYLGHGSRAAPHASAAPTPPSTTCAIAHVGRRYWSHACTSKGQGDVDLMAVSGRADGATHVNAPLRVPDAAFLFNVHTRQPSSDIHRTRSTYVPSPRTPLNDLYVVKGPAAAAAVKTSTMRPPRTKRCSPAKPTSSIDRRARRWGRACGAVVLRVARSCLWAANDCRECCASARKRPLPGTCVRIVRPSLAWSLG